MFPMTNTAFLILYLSRMTSGSPLKVYENARFDPTDEHFFLTGISSINSPSTCMCQCLVYSNCITIAFNGLTQNCVLYSAQLWQGRLQLMTRDTKSIVISRENTSIAAMTSFNSIATPNIAVYAIWNTTAGNDSFSAYPGYSSGNYYPYQPIGMLFDGNVSTTYTSYGACNITTNAVACGANTGMYATFSNGPYLLRAFRICTGHYSSTRDPLIITIEGSNAEDSLLTLGSSWTLLYNGTSGLATDPGRQMFGPMQRVNSSIWYSSYRILVVAKKGDETSVQYNEVEFYT